MARAVCRPVLRTHRRHTVPGVISVSSLLRGHEAGQAHKVKLRERGSAFTLSKPAVHALNGSLTLTGRPRHSPSPETLRLPPLPWWLSGR